MRDSALGERPTERRVDSSLLRLFRVPDMVAHTLERPMTAISPEIKKMIALYILLASLFSFSFSRISEMI